MPSTTQTWIRAELIATGGTAFGPQLMIPADGLEIHGAELVFHCQGEVVYVAQTAQLRSVTWSTKQPNPEATARRSRWPKHGVRWTDEERAQLRTHLLAGESWADIAKAHGRSRSGVQQEAVKQGWVSPETYQMREGLGIEVGPDPTAPDSSPTSAPDSAQTPTAPAVAQTPAAPGAATPAADSAATTAADSTSGAPGSTDAAGAGTHHAVPAPAPDSTSVSPPSPPEAPAPPPESGLLTLGRYLLGRQARTASPDPQASPPEHPAAPMPGTLREVFLIR